MAVGQFASPTEQASLILAEAWNGTTWRTVPTPDVAHSPGQILNGVSCTSPKQCVAVGVSADEQLDNSAVVETWQGTSWRLATLPKVSGATSTTLAGVSCARASSCVAVGESERPGLSPLAFGWNGASWRLETTVDPAGASASLVAVACTSATACVAVGSFLGSKGDRTLAEIWNGTAWKDSTTTNPNEPSAWLAGVSCPAAGSCMAVGYASTSSGTTFTLAESLSRGRWTTRSSLSPTSSVTSELTGIACISASACQAVGPRRKGSLNHGFAESWNGSLWRIETTAEVPAYSSLNAVSCTSTTSCTAVGGAGVKVLVEAWNGKAWTVRATPDPAKAADTSLAGVACVGAQFCLAVGDTQPDQFTQAVFAEKESAGSWKLLGLPRLSGAQSSSLAAVSCTSASACTAVGYYFNASSTQIGLALRWNGTSWTNESLPAGTTSLAGVSCSAGSCMAVGVRDSTMAAESWNGRVWTVRPVAAPSGAADGSQLLAVSCAAASACVAVGDYSNARGDMLNLAELWNGASWKVTNVPDPSRDSGGSELTGVSCNSTKDCTAVGTSSASTAQFTLAEAWNGKAWTIRPTPDPAYLSLLSGVSCRSATMCEAAGSSSIGGPGFDDTLVEAET